ncbi:unnamed protein product [Sphagnum jensenii]|uniref:Uncharacterized protein n=1 Tax=Sphagnum jensenii TaxID=128206 RepID=A0ABP1A8J1_9BRYO
MDLLILFVAPLCQAFGPHYQTSPHDDLLDHPPALEAQSKGAQTERKRDEGDSSCDKEMEKRSILVNKTYLQRRKLERDEEERRAVVRDEKKNLSDKHKCEEAEG